MWKLLARLNAKLIEGAKLMEDTDQSQHFVCVCVCAGPERVHDAPPGGRGGL